MDDFNFIDESVWWPDVFYTKDISGRPDAALCADALVGWENVMSGNKPHKNFGEVLVLISRHLNILPTSESFLKWSFDWLKKTAEETDKNGNP